MVKNQIKLIFFFLCRFLDLDQYSLYTPIGSIKKILLKNIITGNKAKHILFLFLRKNHHFLGFVYVLLLMVAYRPIHNFPQKFKELWNGPYHWLAIASFMAQGGGWGLFLITVVGTKNSKNISEVANAVIKTCLE